MSRRLDRQNTHITVEGCQAKLQVVQLHGPIAAFPPILYRFMHSFGLGIGRVGAVRQFQHFTARIPNDKPGHGGLRWVFSAV
jgi:hypothetical protein